APAVGDALPDDGAAARLGHGVVPVDVIRRLEPTVAELHRATLELADHRAQAVDLLAASHVARDRPAVLAEVAVVAVGREAEGAGGHPVADERLHLADLRLGRLALDALLAEHVLAHGA